jgi:hypothetical protein
VIVAKLLDKPSHIWYSLSHTLKQEEIMLPDEPKKRGRRRKFDTEEWYRYVGDVNVDIAIGLEPGGGMVLNIEPQELESAKWQWYKTFRHMGKSKEFTISMDFDNSQLRIIRRMSSTTSAPTAQIIEGPTIAQIPAPSEWPPSHVQLLNTVSAFYKEGKYTKEDLTKMFVGWMGDNRKQVAIALSNQFDIPLPGLDVTSPDEEDPELEAMMNKVLEEEEKP